MKIFLFYILALDILATFSICQDDLVHQVITNFPPKKIKKIQILNPRKFLKVRSSDTRKWNLKKRVDRKEAYTVFPAIVNHQNQMGAPDSPFFQQDTVEQKVRVKKVLPDYLFNIRRKRSAIKHDVNQNTTIKNKKMRRKHKNRSAADKNDSSKVKQRTGQESPSKLNRTAKVKTLKRKSRSKSKMANSNHQLKYTKKTRERRLRKRKRSGKEKRAKRNQKRYGKVDKNFQKNHQKSQLQKDSRRLIAGKDATIADYPYVVSIQKHNEHWCAGALLNPRLVITTANCIWKSEQLSRLRVRAGSRHADRGGQVARIQEVMKHPGWSIRKNPSNDVALILLDRNIKFSDSVHSLDLPNHAMMPAFEDAWVTSWGAERRDGIFQNTQLTLQVYHSRLLERDKCNNVTQRFGVTVSEDFICLTQTGRRAPCTRDTGAPAVSDGILWGLASWGIRKLCGTERFPAMFSYIASASNLQFITNATHRLMSEQRYYPYPDRYAAQRAAPATAATRHKHHVD